MQTQLAVCSCQAKDDEKTEKGTGCLCRNNVDLPNPAGFAVQVHTDAAVEQGARLGTGGACCVGAATYFQTVEELVQFIVQVLTSTPE